MALDGFSKLAPDIYFSTPSNAETGQLIIIGTCLGAGEKYIAKYIELHK